MQYVPFGKHGFEVSRLGFGAMRIPMIEENGERHPDVQRGVELIRHAIDQGVNYVDTAYVYSGKQNEDMVGEALKGGYREKVKIATKLACPYIESRADMDKMLDEQLKKLGTDHIDFYLLHALNKDRWAKMKELGVLSFLDEAVKDGRIKYPSFSFHDKYDVFEDILTSYDWQMAQIQFNYLDINEQAGLRGLRLAGRRGVPIVVMEPLRGGALASPPPEVKKILERYPEKHSAHDWAFRYVGHFKEVAVQLSGMSTREMVDDNLKIFDDITPGCLSERDQRMIGRLRAAYKKRMPIPCTGCAYCVPCPKGVRIPKIFSVYNESKMFDKPEALPRDYGYYVKEGVDASKCVGCGLCEKQCPQSLPIREWLKTVHKEAMENK
ncbi:MAG: aldo/keto reductase [Clostridia bacterium]|nr:aldo/keto reductase [Clostridia bacterium]